MFDSIKLTAELAAVLLELGGECGLAGFVAAFDFAIAVEQAAVEVAQRFNGAGEY